MSVVRRPRFAGVLLTAVLMLASSGGAQGIRLNEVLPNPSEALGSEWVELVNESNIPVELGRWLIGDALRTVRIADSGAILPARGFVVLVQDSAAFARYYSNGAVTIIEPPSWPVLNNTGDTVRLIDPQGALHDLFAYTEGFSLDATWSRDPFDPARWDRSRDPGGTPGGTNDVIAEWSGGKVSIAVNPQVFSPNGDGVDDSVIIAVNAPDASEYELQIYDREGRKVWELAIAPTGVQPSYVWDGRSSSGGRLPIGIYIVYFESGNGESARETVAIAR